MLLSNRRRAGHVAPRTERSGSGGAPHLLHRLGIVPASVLTPALESFLLDEGYRDLRVIGDVVCGLHRYNFTIGLVVGLSFECYERRYCYESLEDAHQALHGWDGSGHPAGPWIKCKGAGIDLLNPALTA